MALDPNIILAGTQPTKLQGPLDNYQELLALQGAQQQQRMNALNIQGAEMGLRTQQQDADERAALKALYEKAAQGGQEPTEQDLFAVAPTKAPAIIKARAEAAKGKADLQKLNDEHAAAAKDFIGGLAYGIQQSGYDPAVVDHALREAAQFFPDQAKQLAALYQQNPQAFHQQIDLAVAASPKQQQLANERTTAQAHKDQAALAGKREEREANQAQIANERNAKNDAFNQAVRKAELRISQQNANINAGRLSIEQQRNQREAQFTAPEGAANLTGEDFLKTLNPRVAGQVRAIIEGRQAPPSAGNRSQAAQNLLGLVNQADPTFDTNRFHLRKDVESGKIADNIRSMNTSIQHMGELNDTVAALQNGDTRALNSLANRLGYETGKGNGKLPSAELAKTMVRGELAKAATGGQVTVEEQQALGKSLDTAQSPKAVADVARTAAHLLGGKLGAIKDQYNSVMKGHGGDFTVLTDTSRSTLKRLGVNPDDVERAGRGGAAPSSQAATHRFNLATGRIEAVK